MHFSYGKFSYIIYSANGFIRREDGKLENDGHLWELIVLFLLQGSTCISDIYRNSQFLVKQLSNLPEM